MTSPSWNQYAAGAATVIGLGIGIAALGTSMVPPGWEFFSDYAKEVFGVGIALAATGFAALLLFAVRGLQQHRRFATAATLALSDPHAFDPVQRDEQFWGPLAGRSQANVFRMCKGGLLLADVTNTGTNTVTATARIVYTTQNGRRETVDGLWSQRSGDQFIPGGPRKATIFPGESWILAMAIYMRAYGLWLKFGAGYFPPDYRHADDGYWNRSSGERMDLGDRCRLTVQIDLAGTKHIEAFDLSFTEFQPPDDPWVSWRPNVDKITTSSAAPSPTTAPAQSPPSSREST